MASSWRAWAGPADVVNKVGMFEVAVMMIVILMRPAGAG